MSAFRIEIPEPCSESWEGMTPTACGRFCNRCQKEVIDISQIYDEDILQKYLESDDEMCINARADQISPTHITSEVRVRSFAYARLALFALALWTVFSGGLVREVFAQNNNSTGSEMQTPQKGLMVNVKDKFGKPIYQARVLIIREPVKYSEKGPELAEGKFTDRQGSCFIPDYFFYGRHEYILSVHIANYDTFHKITIPQGKLVEVTVKLNCDARKLPPPNPKYDNFSHQKYLYDREPDQSRGMKYKIIDPQKVKVVTEKPRLERIEYHYVFDLDGKSWFEHR